MALRFYPATRAPGALMHGVCEGSWQTVSYLSQPHNPVQYRYELQTSNVGAGSKASRNLTVNRQLDTHYLNLQTPPLQAQTLTAGQTLTICFRVQCRWSDATLGFTNDATGSYKVHVYLADGQTTTVKTVLADNQVDASAFPGTSGALWKTFSVTLAGASVAAGDIIVIEIGTHVLTMPTPVENYYPTATDYVQFTFGYTGATSGGTDATDGASSTALNPWLEFSQTLSLAAAPSPPANDACADATDITAAVTAGRYDSGIVDVSQSADTQRAVWWKLTAPTTGRLVLATFGANYFADIDVFTGSCGSLTPAGFTVTDQRLWPHRSGCSVMLSVTSGTDYFIRVQSGASSFNSSAQAGVCRLQAWYQDTSPQQDDIYLPAGVIASMRNEQIVNFSAAFDAPTGIDFDYTQRAMDDINTGGTNTNVRILVGLFNFELVEILNGPDISYGQWPFQNEVDFIGAPWSVPTIDIHPAMTHVDSAGLLRQQWQGNGFLWIAGIFGSGAPPAVLNDVSNNADYSALKIIDAINGDSQSGAPFTDALQYPTVEKTAAWGGDIDSDGILAYVSGPFYGPIEASETYAGPQTIRLWNTGTNTAAGTFATLALLSGVAPGLRGLRWLSNGGMLVCNGPKVQKLNAAGVVTGTFTPSIALDSQILQDLVILSDGDTAIVGDLHTTRLFSFTISTMTELSTWQPYLYPGTWTQLGAYLPNGVTPVCPGETAGVRQDGLVYTPLSPASCGGTGTRGAARTGT